MAKNEKINDPFQWVQFLNFVDFPEGVESWLRQKANTND